MNIDPTEDKIMQQREQLETELWEEISNQPPEAETEHITGGSAGQDEPPLGRDAEQQYEAAVNSGYFEPERFQQNDNATAKNGKNPDIAARKKIAEKQLGRIFWESPIKGTCTCPGADRHENPGENATIYLDSVPTIHCFHQSCADHVNEANARLRKAIAAVEGTASGIRQESKLAVQDCSTGGRGDPADSQLDRSRQRDW
jgi:hypothetical protein